jgi:predicted permease
LRQRLELVGRLRAGVDLATAQAAVRLLNQQLNQSHPQPREWSVNLLALDRARANPGPRRMLLVVLGAVGFVLLIACVNVANLLFVRALVRQREFAVRTALGAGGGRLVRQVLTESLVLVAGGTGGGLLLAQWAVQAIWRRMPSEVNFLTLNRVHLDWRVFLFTGGLAGLATVLCGLVPALQAARSDPQRALGATARTGTGSRQQRRWQQGFVVAQSALAFVLLVGAGLLMRGFVRLSAVDPGFETRNLAALSLELPASRYPSEASRQNFFAQLRERLTALPGVADVALAAAIPPRTSGFSSLSAVEAEGRAPESLGRELLPYNTVGDDYFRVMRIPLLRGRNFGEQDAAGGPVAIIVNDRFARRFWPDGDPLGRRLRLAPNQPWMTVVGVVGDVKAMSLDDEDGSLEYYRAIRQDGVGRYATLAIRTTIEPRLLMPSIRGEVVGLDSRLPISRLATAGDLMADTLAVTRFSLGLMSVFAGLAILLATLGLYGVMAYTVAQRTSEIGVRIALGGTSGQIALFVARRGLALLGTGLLAGGLAAAMLTRFLRTLLFEISPLDPTTFAGVAALLGLAGACACWLPARRAARMDPVVALRAE